MCIHTAEGKGEKKPHWREADPGLKAGRADDSAAGKGRGGPNLQIGGKPTKEAEEAQESSRTGGNECHQKAECQMGLKRER